MRHWQYITWFVLLIWTNNLLGQEPYKSTNGIIVMDYSNEGVLEEKGDSTFRYLFGDVEIRQDSVFMYADTALVLNDTMLFANGNILIQQGDSLSILSERLTYNANQRNALLDEDVVLISSEQRMYTPNLFYDLNSRIARFDQGALLTNDTTQLTSKSGYFDTALSQALFRDSVRVVGDSFNLQADSILYFIELKRVDFLSPTLITHEANKLYCEEGFYLVDEGKAELTKKPQYVGKDLSAEALLIKYDERQGLVQLIEEARLKDSLSLMQASEIRYFEQEEKLMLIEEVKYQKDEVVVTGDTAFYYRALDAYDLYGHAMLADKSFVVEADDQIFYDDSLGTGYAKGHVILSDTTNQTSLFCDSTLIRSSGDSFSCLGGSFGRPFALIEGEEGDSLFIVADTFLLNTIKDTIQTDSVISRTLDAFQDVRVFGDQIQAICDSLSYLDLDSLMYFYGDPFAWSDSSQFTADTMFAQLANESIEKIHLNKNALVINSPDLLFFNQLKGRQMDVYFRGDSLDHLMVNGNVESIYFVQDEASAYVGMNKILSAQMKMYFAENSVKKLTFYQKPDGTTIPMAMVGRDPEKLAGFNWDLTFRPNTFLDLFAPEKKRRQEVVEPSEEATPVYEERPDPSNAGDESDTENKDND